ncbi:MAG: hypothetical protein FJ291_01305 [Planctomycetes bacterium]|nr:hypothetical protein [Planctomycetota bacterium]
MATPDAWKDPANRWARALFVIMIANFFSFVVVAYVIGGDAVNGHSENGRYYVSLHGADTEVSHAVFIYSYVHALSQFVTFPLGMIGGLWVATTPRPSGPCAPRQKPKDK